MTTKLETLEDGGQQAVMGGDGFDEKIVITDVSEVVDSAWEFIKTTDNQYTTLIEFIERQYPPMEGLNPMVREDAKELEIRHKYKNRLIRLKAKVDKAQLALWEMAAKFRTEFGMSGKENETNEK